MNSHTYKNDTNKMVIFKCIARETWLEKVLMPSELYIFDAPEDAVVEIHTLDQQLVRHYRIKELNDATIPY